MKYLSRTFLKYSVKDLESFFIRNSNNIDILKKIHAELTNRKTKRARNLMIKIIHRIHILKEIPPSQQTNTAFKLESNLSILQADETLAGNLERELSLSDAGNIAQPFILNLEHISNYDRPILDLVNGSQVSVRLQNALNISSLPFETVGEYMDAGPAAITRGMQRIKNFGLKSAQELDELVKLFLQTPSAQQGKDTINTESTPNEELRSKILLRFENLTLKSVIFKKHLTTRLRNAIFNHEILDIGFCDFINAFQQNSTMLLRIPNFGKASLIELQTICADEVALELLKDHITSPNLETITANILDKNVAWAANILGVDGEKTQKRNISPPMNSSTITYVEWLLDQLPERMSEILNRRFGINQDRGETLEEIGIDFGITRERIRQIEAKAFMKLRIILRSFPIAPYLKKDSLSIWKALSTDNSILLKNMLRERECLLDPHYFLAFEIGGIELSEFLDGIAENHTFGWYLDHSTSGQIRQSAEKIKTIIASRPLPFAINGLSKHKGLSNIEAAILLVLGLPIFNGYVLPQVPRARLKRALGLHTLLDIANASLPLLILLEEYHKFHPDDLCNARDAEIVMEALPHLFVEITANRWKSLGAGGILKKSEKIVNQNYQGPTAGEDNSISSSLYTALLESGPTQLRDLFENAETILPEGRSINSIGPILLTRCDLFIRVLPGVYGLPEQVLNEQEILIGDMHYLLNEAQARIYARARHAGEPWSTFPLWTPAAEYRLCCWAKHSGSRETISSLLSIASIDHWPVSDDEKSKWHYLVHQHAGFQLSEPINIKAAFIKPEIDRLYAGLVLALEYGSLNWIAANRISGKRIDAHSGTGLVALLVQLGTLAMPNDVNDEYLWDIPYYITPYAKILCTIIGEALHEEENVNWETGLGTKLIKTIKDNDDIKVDWFDIDLLLAPLESGSENLNSDVSKLDPVEDIFEKHRKSSNMNKQKARLVWLLEE